MKQFLLVLFVMTSLGASSQQEGLHRYVKTNISLPCEINSVVQPLSHSYKLDVEELPFTVEYNQCPLYLSILSKHFDVIQNSTVLSCIMTQNYRTRETLIKISDGEVNQVSIDGKFSFAIEEVTYTVFLMAFENSKGSVCFPTAVLCKVANGEYEIIDPYSQNNRRIIEIFSVLNYESLEKIYSNQEHYGGLVQMHKGQYKLNIASLSQKGAIKSEFIYECN